jgi:hypothetical protein
VYVLQLDNVNFELDSRCVICSFNCSYEVFLDDKKNDSDDIKDLTSHMEEEHNDHTLLVSQANKACKKNDFL